MRWRPYPKYKESGVEWLGQVPEHWQVKPLKWVGCFRGGSGFPPEHQGQQNNALAFFKVKDIELANSEGYLGCPDSTVDYAVARSLRAHVFELGTVVFAKVGAALLLGRIRQLAASACVDNNMMGCEVRASEACERFLYWAMHPVRFADLANPGAVPSLNESQISTWPTVFPSLDEQAPIARFLDRETAKIDALIAKQERLIELLQEKRQALISHVVTKGLNPDAPMKPSCVEWLGDVPAHWECKRLKFAVPSITVGIVVTPAKYYVDDGVPCLRSLNISGKVIDRTELVYISPESNQLLGKSIIRAGDVVVVRTGQTGTAAVIPANLDGANCIDLLIIRRSASMLPEFLWHFLNADLTVAQVAAVSEGAIQSHYNTSTLSQLMVCVPPIQEQLAILDFLDREAECIDALINRASGAISLMRERRTALISAAVTGKIDVRSVDAGGELLT
jgi:type I restriction enzyme S subunit